MFTREMIKAIAGSRFSSARFTKTDGTIRSMRFRLGSGKYINPNSRGLSNAQMNADKNLEHLRVLDTDIAKENKWLTKEEWIAAGHNPKDWKIPYRTIPAQRVLELKAGGRIWTRKDEKTWIVQEA